jgi:uncharacterized protein DUF3106
MSRSLCILALLMVATPASAAERAVDPDSLIFLGEFAALETGLQAHDLGFRDDGIRWQDLDLTQREILADAQEGWALLSAEDRWWLVLGSVRWADLPGRQRRLVNDQQRAWDRLTVAQQRRIRGNLSQFSALDEDQRRALRDRYRDFSNLSPGQQRRLRENFESMSEADRARLRERMRESEAEVLSAEAAPPDPGD